MQAPIKRITDMLFLLMQRNFSFIFKIISKYQCSPGNKYKTDYPCNRFANANGNIAFYRYDPESKDNFTNQFQNTAKQRRKLMAHSLESISHNNEK